MRWVQFSMIGLAATGCIAPRNAPLEIGDPIGANETKRDGRELDECLRENGPQENSNVDRWRSATTNYVPLVNAGTPPITRQSRQSFGSYIVTFHNRVHPLFAERFLRSLDALTTSPRLNDPMLFTKLEIVLDGEDGHLVQIGVLHPSGDRGFDIGALASVQCASPFGKPPKEAVSADGRVYFQWDFQRDPVFACSTIKAKLFVLKDAPSKREMPAMWDAGTVE
jgi:hypothetical protein